MVLYERIQDEEGEIQKFKRIKLNYNNNNNSNFETLFFKVIKNKFLFKKILFNLKRNPFTLDYYRIIDIGWMIKNNRLQLLKDKILSNGYIIVTNNTTIYNQNQNNLHPNNNNQNQNNQVNQVNQIDYNFDPFFIILEYLRDEEISFYKILFRNYSKHFPRNTIEEMNRLVSFCIRKGCLGAIQCLVENYGFIVTSKHLEEAIQFNVKFESEQFKNLKEWITQQIFVSDEILDLIPNNIPFQDGGKNRNRTVFKIINYFMRLLHPTVPLQLNLKTFYNPCPFDLVLSELIEASHSILYLYEKGCIILNNNSNNNNNNNNGCITECTSNDHQENEEDNKFIENLLKNKLTILNEWKGFNEKELKTRVELFSNKDKRILKLIQVYLSVLDRGTRCQRFYLKYERDEYGMLLRGANVGARLYLSFALEYGSNQLLRGWFDGGQNNTYDVVEIYISLYFQVKDREYEICHLLEYQPYLFQRCEDDRKDDRDGGLEKLRKVKFIEEVCKDILNTEIPTNKKLEPLFFFNLVVDYDDLDLVVIAFKWLAPLLKNPLHGVEYRNPNSHLSFNVYKYIRSIPVLTFIYYNLNDQDIRDKSFITSCRLEPWYLYGRLELLKAYEHLTGYQGQDFEFTHRSCPRISFRSNSINRYLINVIKHIVSNPQIYHFDSLVLDCLKYYPEIRLNYVSDIQYIIENTPQFEYRPFKISCSIFGTCNPTSVMGNYCFSSTSRIRLFDWILTTRKQDVTANGRCSLFAQELNEMKYLTGRLDELINFDFKNQQCGFVANTFCKSVFQRIGEQGDVESLCIIMKLFFPTLQQSLSLPSAAKNNLYELLIGAVGYGRINIFKFLKLNYNFIFLPVINITTTTTTTTAIVSTPTTPTTPTPQANNNNNGGGGIFSSVLLNVLFAKVIEKDYLELYELMVNDLKFKMNQEQFYFHSRSSISINNNLIVN